MEHHESLWTGLFNSFSGLHVSDGLVLATISFLILVAVAFIGTRRLSVGRPGLLQQVLEVCVGGFASFVDETIPHGGRKHLPLMFGFACFIFVSNFMGLIPTFGSATSAYAITVSLALISFVYYNAVAIKSIGFGGHLKHFCGPVLLLAPLMFPIELVGHFARIASLSLRLFGNISGEHAASGVFYTFLGGYIAPLPMMALGLFGSCLQTFIFVLLSMIYIQLSSGGDH